MKKKLLILVSLSLVLFFSCNDDQKFSTAFMEKEGVISLPSGNKLSFYSLQKEKTDYKPAVVLNIQSYGFSPEINYEYFLNLNTIFEDMRYIDKVVIGYLSTLGINGKIYIVLWGPYSSYFVLDDNAKNFSIPDNYEDIKYLLTTYKTTNLDDLLKNEDAINFLKGKHYIDKDENGYKENFISPIGRSHVIFASDGKFSEYYYNKDSTFLYDEKGKISFPDKSKNYGTNLNNEKNISTNMGMWIIKNYVDEFGDKTKKCYITNFVHGTFSNSATTNSDLGVQFLINDKNNFDLQLYEYADNKPVRGSYDYPQKFYVSVKSSDGNIYKLPATDTSDRLTFNKIDSLKLHNLFLQNGSVKFHIDNEDTTSTQYDFTIDSTAGYENAYKSLIATKS